jgi:hypothetical protein
VAVGRDPAGRRDVPAPGRGALDAAGWVTAEPLPAARSAGGFDEPAPERGEGSAFAGAGAGAGTGEAGGGETGGGETGGGVTAGGAAGAGTDGAGTGGSGTGSGTTDGTGGSDGAPPIGSWAHAGPARATNRTTTVSADASLFNATRSPAAAITTLEHVANATSRRRAG